MGSCANVDCAHEIILNDVIDVRVTEPTGLHKHIHVRPCRVPCACSTTKQGHPYLHVVRVRLNTLQSAKHGHVIARHANLQFACTSVVTSAQAWYLKESVSQSRARQPGVCVCVCVYVCERAEMIGQTLFPLCLFRAQSRKALRFPSEQVWQGITRRDVSSYQY